MTHKNTRSNSPTKKSNDALSIADGEDYDAATETVSVPQSNRQITAIDFRSLSFANSDFSACDNFFE